MECLVFLIEEESDASIHMDLTPSKPTRSTLNSLNNNGSSPNVRHNQSSDLQDIFAVPQKTPEIVTPSKKSSFSSLITSMLTSPARRFTRSLEAIVHASKQASPEMHSPKASYSVIGQLTASEKYLQDFF